MKVYLGMCCYNIKSKYLSSIQGEVLEILGSVKGYEIFDCSFAYVLWPIKVNSTLFFFLYSFKRQLQKHIV